MIELHGWITIRETYKITDDENDEVIKSIENEIRNLKYPNLKIQTMNGESYVEFSLFSNHKAKDSEDLLLFFEKVGKIAKGSYGLIYLNDDENNEKNNRFQVFRLVRGKVDTFDDKFLSPFIPTIEDK